MAKTDKVMLAVVAALTAGGAARAQDVPHAISPLQVESDRNGVNLVDGRIVMELPVLAVPAAPNLRFDRLQNAAPSLSGNVIIPPGNDTDHRTYAVHTGAGTSDSFECWPEPQCLNLSGSGSAFNWHTRTYWQAGSGTVWQFGQAVTPAGSNRPFHYASYVSYPNGEAILYHYEAANLSGYGNVRRPDLITSTLGYFIALTYQGNDVNADLSAWSRVAAAALYGAAAPTCRSAG